MRRISTISASIRYTMMKGADTSSRVPAIRPILGGGWIIPPYPAGDALEILRGGSCPANLHIKTARTVSRLQDTFDVLPHLLRRDEVAAVGGGDAEFHSLSKAGFIV